MHIVSAFLVTVFSVSLAAAQTARADASQTGTYDSSKSDSSSSDQRDQQPGVLGGQSDQGNSRDTTTSSTTSSTSTTDSSVYNNPSPSYPSTSQQPGTTDTTSPVSTTEAPNMDKSYLSREAAAIQPQVGMINYHDTLGNTANRMTYGMTGELNIPRILNNPDVFLGPQLGFFYSHLGSANAGFFGATPGDQSAVGYPGANMFYIPTDLKLGFNLGNFRPAIHGGANLIYRSVASAMAVSKNAVSGTDSAWSYMPNLGLDLEYAVTRDVVLIGRPDVTFGGSNRIWTASIGASFPLG